MTRRGLKPLQWGTKATGNREDCRSSPYVDVQVQGTRFTMPPWRRGHVRRCEPPPDGRNTEEGGLEDCGSDRSSMKYG